MQTEPFIVDHTIWIAAPRERVWKAITDPEQVMQWFVPNLPYGTMKRDDSGKLTIYMGELGIDFAILETVDAPRQLISRSLPERLLTTTYTLEDQNEGTLVTVTMTGFDSLPEDARGDRLHLMSMGWEKALKNLNAYIGGTELPFPKAYIGSLFGYWREYKENLAIERSIWIAAPRERVWRALTDPEQIQAWFSPGTPWHLTALEVGGRLYVHSEETNTEMYVEIIEILDAPHQLVTRAIPEPPDTVVKGKTYTLKEENGGTRLIVTLTGYASEPDDSRWDHMEENAFGFGMMLQSAKAYIEEES